MSLRSQFTVDEKLVETGIPIKFGKNTDGTFPTFYVSRINKANKTYAKALEAAFKPYQRQIQLKTIDDDLAGKLLLEVFCKTILKGWENVKLADVTGQSSDEGEAPFNYANAVALMEALPELYDELQSQASEAANFREGVLEGSAGN